MKKFKLIKQDKGPKEIIEEREILEGQLETVTTGGYTRSDMLEPRTGGSFRCKSFWLSPEYNWEIGVDEENATILLPTKKVII